jgi:hypothetical protein
MEGMEGIDIASNRGVEENFAVSCWQLLLNMDESTPSRKKAMSVALYTKL